MREKTEIVYQKLRHNLSIIRGKWWHGLCEMCHQNRKSRPGLTPSMYDDWCDECFCELPLWLRYRKPTQEELERSKQKEEKAALARRQKREEKAKSLAKKTAKKVKLTGFENVENEEESISQESIETTSQRRFAEIEEQRQKLESIFLYEKDD